MTLIHLSAALLLGACGGDGGKLDGDGEHIEDAGDLDADGDGFVARDDCDDGDAAVHPDATETCNEVDDDCDGDIDEGLTETFYEDADGDGHGNDYSAILACEQPQGFVAIGGDCDDGDATANPDQDESCDGIDNDCDGAVDEDTTDGPTWYADSDDDGFGDIDSPLQSCPQPAGHVDDATDCDDDDPLVNPDADEVCDGIDNDCDGEVDIDAVDGVLYYLDLDSDGYGDPDSPIIVCELSSGTVTDDTDCDDLDASIHPGAPELCDGVDNDCDGNAEADLAVPTDYSSIGAALSAASEGETICVAAGTYAETVDFSGKDVVLHGVDGAGSTIIDGAGTGPVVRFENGESAGAALIGFTVTGGDAEQGAGIRIVGADPTLSDLVITENICSGSDVQCQGVGLYVSDSEFSLSDSSISDNDAQGTYNSGGYANAYGVGLYMEDCESSIVAVDITGNTMSATGSEYEVGQGIGVYGIRTFASWIGGTLADNAMPGTRGDNSYAYGGGLYFTGDWYATSFLEMEQVLITDNRIDATKYAHGAGTYMGSLGLLVFNNVIVSNNTAGGSANAAYGGGIYVGWTGVAELHNCDVVGNTADAVNFEYGGGIYGYTADITLVNTNVVGNRAGLGGGLGANAAAYVGETDISYSNFYDNGEDEFEAYTDPVGEDGNISVDPLYVDASAVDGIDWDLSLSSGSTCIDAGDSSITDTDGTTSDIGAYGGPGGVWP